MCLFSKKFLIDNDDAEDIVQEVFIELWNQQTRFESIEQIKAFLYIAVKNRCLNFKKHLKVREKFVNHAVENTEQYFHLFECKIFDQRRFNNSVF